MKITYKTNFSTADRICFADNKSFSSDTISKEEFAGEKNSTVLVREGKQRILYVGLGKPEEVNARTVRAAAGVATLQLGKIGAKTIEFALEGLESFAQEIVEGAVQASYKFETFLPKDRKRKTTVSTITLVSEDKSIKKPAANGLIIANATNYVREIGNLPGNEIYPESLAKQAKDLAKELPALKVKVWTEAVLKKEGFGGILAVGKGSERGPRFIKIDYQGAKKSDPTTAIVGKAITFDTGGISLKPGAEMDEMKFDKMGGVAVLGILKAAAELKLPINLVGLIASAENMPSHNAYRPGDIIPTYSGKTIEVLNTDAEGRIVLADALAYADKHYQPKEIIELSTLTGACLIALGNLRAGVFTRDNQSAQSLFAAGEKSGDRVWHLPMGDEFSEAMKSEIADVKNLGGGRLGGASSAASFLENFVGNTPFTHIDIAGPAWTTKPLPGLQTGATGFGVKLLLEYLRK